MTTPARLFSAEVLASAARTARLDVAPERLETVGRTLTEMYALIDRLDDVPLGDTPPATAFDPRWEA